MKLLIACDIAGFMVRLHTAHRIHAQAETLFRLIGPSLKDAIITITGYCTGFRPKKSISSCIQPLKVNGHTPDH